MTPGAADNLDASSVKYPYMEVAYVGVSGA